MCPTTRRRWSSPAPDPVRPLSGADQLPRRGQTCRLWDARAPSKRCHPRDRTRSLARAVNGAAATEPRLPRRGRHRRVHRRTSGAGGPAPHHPGRAGEPSGRRRARPAHPRRARPLTARINIVDAHEIVHSVLVRPITGTIIRAGGVEAQWRPRRLLREQATECGRADDIVYSVLVRPITGTFVRAGEVDPRRKEGAQGQAPGLTSDAAWSGT